MAQPYPPQAQPAYPPGSYPPGYSGQPVTMAGAPQVVYAQPAVMAQPIVMGATPQVMVVQQARIYGKLPVATTCPFCNRSITTSVVTQPGCFAWASAGILCVIGCWPCCLIPFCMPSAMDAVHSCPACGAGLGIDPGSC